MLTILNDCHIGTIRSSGTTPATQIALREHLISSFKALLPDNDLMILGDLFDKENIPIADVLKTYYILADFLKTGHQLILVAGNHDLSKTSSTMSSFDFLCKLLTSLYGEQVTAIHAPTMTDYGYVIPHLQNQDLFDLALESVPECDNLFLHCNYNNNFAAQSDQSLNLSKEQADRLPVKNIVIAHEHHSRVLGKVILPGNQIASSCSDWATATNKYATHIEDDVVRLVEVCYRGGDFTEQVWKNLAPSSHKFVKVVGKATAAEATAVITAISKFRQTSPALVITNGVEIETEGGTEQFDTALESASSFDIWSALKTYLTEAEINKLESL